MIMKNKGFTLIEVLLILVVIATAAGYRISMNMHHQRQQQIDLTAMATKNWLEAGLAFFADNHHWPHSTVELMQQGYLPEGSDCSHWPSSKSRWVPSTTCKAHAAWRVFYQPQARYFQVGLLLPNERIAQALAKQLPAAEVIAEADAARWVVASVPIPGMPQGWIEDAGVAMSQSSIPLPDCPGGYEGHYQVFPLAFTSGFWPWDDRFWNKHSPRTFVYQSVGDSRLKYDSQKQLYKINPRSKTCDSQHDDSHYREPFAVVQYVTFCVQQGHWQVLADPNSALNASDWQCSDAWYRYNNHHGQAPHAAYCPKVMPPPTTSCLQAPLASEVS